MKRHYIWRAGKGLENYERQKQKKKTLKKVKVKQRSATSYKQHLIYLIEVLLNLVEVRRSELLLYLL